MGSNKYNRLLGLADMLQKDWSNESGIDWTSLYELVSIGNVTATDTFDLDDTIRKVSLQEGDFVYVTKSGVAYYYDLVDPTRFRSFSGSSEAWVWGTTSKAVARIGRTLKFPVAFKTTDAQFGGTITVPSYVYVDDITRGTDEIQVDDPMWLVYMMAAEYVRNDQVKQGQYPALIDRANDRMEAMKRNNGTQLESVVNLTNLWGAGETWI